MYTSLKKNKITVESVTLRQRDTSSFYQVEDKRESLYLSPFFLQRVAGGTSRSSYGPIPNRAIVSFRNLRGVRLFFIELKSSLSLSRSLIHGFRFGTVSAELSKLAGCPMAT